MRGVYLFATAAGLPLALWFALSGSGDGDGDATGDGGDGVAGVMFRLLPLSTVALALATFGVCGLVLGALGTGSGATLAGAAATGAGAGILNSTVFAYLRRTSTTSGLRDDQLAGAMGQVVVPIAAEGRGRVAVEVGGQRVHLSATALPDAATGLGVGQRVLVVEVRHGIALVTALDPELN